MRLLQKASHVAVRVNCGEDRLSSAEIVVKLGSDVDAVVGDQELIIRIPYRGQSLRLGDKPFKFNRLSQGKELLPIGRGFDMTDISYAQPRPNLRREGKDSFDKRTRSGRAVDRSDIGQYDLLPLAGV